MSQDETHSIRFSERQHGDVQLHSDTVSCMDVETALWGQNKRRHLTKNTVKNKEFIKAP